MTSHTDMTETCSFCGNTTPAGQASLRLINEGLLAVLDYLNAKLALTLTNDGKEALRREIRAAIEHANAKREPTVLEALYSLSGEFAESWDTVCRMVTEEMGRSEATKGHVVGQGGKCWCGETHRKVAP